MIIKHEGGLMVVEDEDVSAEELVKLSDDLSDYLNRIKSDLEDLDAEINRRICEIDDRLIRYAVKLAPYQEPREAKPPPPSLAVPARPARWIILLSQRLRDVSSDLTIAEEKFSGAMKLAAYALQHAEETVDRQYRNDCQLLERIKAAASSADLGDSRLNRRRTGMIIKYLDGDYDDVTTDTDTASREQLVEACVALKEANDLITLNVDKWAAAMAQRGLSFEGPHINKTSVEIIDLKACAWFGQALADYTQETIDSRVDAALGEGDDEGATRTISEPGDVTP